MVVESHLASPTVPRGTAIVGGIALLFTGVILGLFLRRGPAEQGPHPPRELVPRPEAIQTAEPADPRVDVVRLETRVRELEEELNASHQVAAMPNSELTAAALDEVFKTFLEASSLKKPDPEKMRTLLARLGQLDEKTTGYFIDRYRKSRGGEERTVALQLALASGGAEAADFVSVLLNDATLDVFTRTELLRELGGNGWGLFSIRRLPVSEALGSTAMTLCRSSDTDDRTAGAGLLGGVQSGASRAELRRLVEEDTELGVRVTAVLSLGHVGDPSTRTYLERLSTSPDATRLREAIESALKELAEGPR